ncbi:MAG: DNA/RNA non-specific endonuclease, partial [Treponemataceae bacterium]|nr:DNA/RNA non-specific endonuclease [Treponemataceae bacterium]
TGAAGFFESIELPTRKDAGYAGGGSGGAIAVPAACWKVILVLEEGDDDFSRVTAETPAIAVFIPNRQGVARVGAWTHFLTTVDDIEEKTGFDFFSFLPDDIESAVEARKYAVPGE